MLDTKSESAPFIVDSILRANELHLIFGPIVEDCTILALYLLNEWSHARPVFTRASHPLPYVYVSCEESETCLAATMEYVKLDPSATPHVSLLNRTRPDDHNVAGALAIARRVNPALRVLFLDGMLSLCPGRINDYRESSRFLRETVGLCHKERITIIGCVSSAKAREGAGYMSMRDRMHGSTAWSSASKTKIFIEANRPTNVHDVTRAVTLLPHLDDSATYQYSKANRAFSFVGNELTRMTMEDWLATQDTGAEITTRELLNVGTQLNISETTVYDWIKNQCAGGILSKSKRGIYIVSPRLLS